jgi:hypothetical protein
MGHSLSCAGSLISFSLKRGFSRFTKWNSSGRKYFVNRLVCWVYTYYFLLWSETEYPLLYCYLKCFISHHHPLRLRHTKYYGKHYNGEHLVTPQYILRQIMPSIDYGLLIMVSSDDGIIWRNIYFESVNSFFVFFFVILNLENSRFLLS